ncbi:hypothetical protein ACIA5D_51630 [Actinoplanes sp. NPDC051513]|uniref:hypothetical protein n=1 Tax=Actinoplanes sp. NPDC051513 TaxID=3363908 RepID=UPI0037A5B5B6
MDLQVPWSASPGATFPGTHRKIGPAVRNAAIGALRTTGFINIAAANRHHARNSNRSFAFGIT